MHTVSNKLQNYRIVLLTSHEICFKVDLGRHDNILLAFGYNLKHKIEGAYLLLVCSTFGYPHG